MSEYSKSLIRMNHGNRGNPSYSPYYYSYDDNSYHRGALQYYTPLPAPPPRPKSRLEIPLRVAADVDRTAQVWMIELVQRWSTTWHTYFYTLELHTVKDKKAKTYWIQMTPCARWPASAKGRPGVCDVLWHNPVPEAFLMRRQLYNPAHPSAMTVTVGMLVDVIQINRLHEFVFSIVDGPEEELQMEWCGDVLRAWAKRGLVDASEARITRWQHIQAPGDLTRK